MKWIIYMLLLLGVAMLPTEATDVGRLIPVEVVAVSENKGTATVKTDTGDIGIGADLGEAFRNMEDTAAGVLYLDTAEYLILEEGMEQQLPLLQQYLKENVRVCYGDEEISLKGIASYLSVHRPDLRLGEISTERVKQLITEENERYQLTRK